jgi:hypothetical protein
VASDNAGGAVIVFVVALRHALLDRLPENAISSPPMTQFPKNGLFIEPA